MENPVAALILNLLIVILEIIGAFYSFRKDRGKAFSWFTIDSNLLLLFSSLLASVYGVLYFAGCGDIPSFVGLVQYLSLATILLTFVVVLFFLAPKEAGKKGPRGFFSLFLDKGMLYHHLLCPVLGIIDFLLFERGEKIPFSFAFYSLIPTLLYGIVLSVLNQKGIVDGPYPFLRTRKIGLGKTVLSFVLLLAFSFLLSLSLYYLKNLTLQ